MQVSISHIVEIRGSKCQWFKVWHGKSIRRVMVSTKKGGKYMAFGGVLMKTLLLYKKMKNECLKQSSRQTGKNRNDRGKWHRNIQKLSACLNAGRETDCECPLYRSFQQIMTCILRKAFFGHGLERRNKEVQVSVRRYYLLYIERFVRQDQRFKAKIKADIRNPLRCLLDSVEIV